MKKLVTICAVLGMVLAISSTALATMVTLVPSTLDVARGDTVDVSVYMTITEAITMSAISTEFVYDADVFTYDGLTKGALLTQNWDLMGNQNPPLRIGGFLWDPPFMESFELGAGTVFTFALKVDENAAIGTYELAWGDAGNGVGFAYGDENFQDIVLPSLGASINVVPEPMTMLLLGLGAVLLRKKK